MAERFLIPELPRSVAKMNDLPEDLQKKKVEAERLQAEKEAAEKALRKEREQRRAELVVNIEKYRAEYRALAEGRAKAEQDAEAAGGFYRAPEAKVVFAIRLHGTNKLAPKPKKILQLLRLRQLNNGVFIKMNKATLEMIKSVTPFITFGYPSVEAIRELIYKRGYCRVGKRGAWSRQRISDNEIVHENLGKFGLHSVEDLIHEIFTCGPHFKEANAFLWPFKLRCPRGGFVSKRHGFCEAVGGDWGNREELIDDLIRRMN